MTRIYPSKWFFVVLVVALVAWMAYSIVDHRKHLYDRRSENIVTHREAVREAGELMKTEIAAKHPEVGITQKSNEAQILIAFGRAMAAKDKEIAELRAEVGRLKAAHGEAAAASMAR
jgi:hypothetical protein